MLGSILEKSDGTIATTGSKDFTILRKEVCSPQSTLGHLATPQKSPGFTQTFHPSPGLTKRDKDSEPSGLLRVADRNMALPKKQKQLRANHKHWQRECAFSFLPANPSVGWYLLHVWKLFILTQHIWNNLIEHKNCAKLGLMSLCFFPGFLRTVHSIMSSVAAKQSRLERSQVVDHQSWLQGWHLLGGSIQIDGEGVDQVRCSSLRLKRCHTAKVHAPSLFIRMSFRSSQHCAVQLGNSITTYS